MWAKRTFSKSTYWAMCKKWKKIWWLYSIACDQTSITTLGISIDKKRCRCICKKKKIAKAAIEKIKKNKLCACLRVCEWVSGGLDAFKIYIFCMHTSVYDIKNYSRLSYIWYDISMICIYDMYVSYPYHMHIF